LLDFLVVDFLELDFFEDFFFAMALSPPFVRANLRVAKIKVNVFLRRGKFFLDARSAPAPPRADPLRARRRAESRADRAGFRTARASKKMNAQTPRRREGRGEKFSDLFLLLTSASRRSLIFPVLVRRAPTHKMTRSVSVERIAP
jgi:hypothetical protein